MDNKLWSNNNDVVTASLAQPITPTVYFKGDSGKEILRLEPNGDIYVNGTLAENDKQVVDGMRKFLLSHGY